MAAIVTPYLDLLVDFLDAPDTKELFELGARFIYTEENEFTFNLIPSIVAVLLGIIIIGPLLSSLPALFKSSSSGSGYGYGAETSYGPPESSYGGPEYRSYQEYEEVQDVVRSSPGQQAENRMDYARSLNMAAPLAEQLANSATKLVQ